MKRIVFTTAVLLLAAFSAMAQNNAKGYYKDVLLDGGIALTSKSFIPSTIYLDLSTQFLLRFIWIFPPSSSCLQRGLKKTLIR